MNVMTYSCLEDFTKDLRSRLVDGALHDDVILSMIAGHELPDLSDVESVEYFNCCYSNVRSLKGSPKRVEGDYSCFYSKYLNSLEGLPEYIGGRFFIDKETWNKLPKDTNEAMYLVLNNKLRLI